MYKYVYKKKHKWEGCEFWGLKYRVKKKKKYIRIHIYQYMHIHMCIHKHTHVKLVHSGD